MGGENAFSALTSLRKAPTSNPLGSFSRSATVWCAAGTLTATPKLLSAVRKCVAFMCGTPPASAAAKVRNTPPTLTLASDDGAVPDEQVDGAHEGTIHRLDPVGITTVFFLKFITKIVDGAYYHPQRRARPGFILSHVMTVRILWPWIRIIRIDAMHRQQPLDGPVERLKPPLRSQANMGRR
mgnify:CR=1 FL=1